MDINTNVTLRIAGSAVDPDVVSAAMGMAPDQSHRKGDVHGARTHVLRKQGYWSITSSSHVNPSADTNEHIEWLIQQVAPKIKLLADYCAQGWNVDVVVAIHTSAGHGGPTLRPAVLSRLAALGLEVSLDLYPDA